MPSSGKKVAWKGVLLAVQPRIRLQRSFDESSHSYLGYVLTLEGMLAGAPGEFRIAIGKAAQAKHQFRKGDQVCGASHPVQDARLETAEYYQTSGLKLLQRGAEPEVQTPPWVGVPPALEIYRERGHRRLHTVPWGQKCRWCLWGCRMPVEIIVDPWNPGQKRYRLETFCYGPKSCPLYQAGPTRKVPGRRGLVWEEEDWVDQQATAHREGDE